MAKKFSGIIFDFNGVMLWDTPWHEAVLQKVAVQLRGKSLSPSEMRNDVEGRTNQAIFSYVLGRNVSEAELPQLADMKESMYREYALSQGDAFCLSPSTEQLLNYLAQHHFPQTIATNSEITNVRFYFEHLRLNRWFDIMNVVYNDGRLPGKPDPTIYISAAEKIGLAPEACIVVEDSLAGIAAARNAKIGKVIALGPADRHDELRRVPGVDEVISELGQINRQDFAISELFTGSTEHP